MIYLRKFLLIVCSVTAIILFANGLYILGIPGHQVLPDGGEPGIIERLQGQSSMSTREPMNLLILGLDGEEVRSDVILLLNFSPEKKGLNILSISRDTLVKRKGKYRKINSIVASDGELLVAETVEKLTGLPVDYYLTMNFKGFRKIVDTLGGVDFNVPMDMDYDDPVQNLHIHLKKGWQHLDGKKAEQFVRYRKGNKPGEGYEDGDLDRMKAQQEFLKALIQQKFKLKYIDKVDDIYFILKDHVKTNIQAGDLGFLANSVRRLDSGNIHTFSAPGVTRFLDNVWYFICDTDKTAQLVEDHFYR